MKSLILKATLKTVSPLMANAGIEIQRKQLDFLSSFKRKFDGLYLKPAELGDVKAEWFEPVGSPNTPVVLYFHGGAYVTGSLVSSRVLASELAQTSKLKVLSFEYRLAPEHPYPCALEDALTVYEHLLESGFKPDEIVFVGESAGGGLALATALALKQCGREMPAAIACLSPWTDLTCEGISHVTNAGKDPMLSTESLKQSALQYAGEEALTCPMISPAYGEFEGFPPTLIQVGMDEVLFCDAYAVNDKMLSSHVDVELSAWEGMWHVWHLYDIKEAFEALEQVSAFIHKNTRSVY